MSLDFAIYRSLKVRTNQLTSLLVDSSLFDIHIPFTGFAQILHMTVKATRTESETTPWSSLTISPLYGKTVGNSGIFSRRFYTVPDFRHDCSFCLNAMTIRSAIDPQVFNVYMTTHLILQSIRTQDTPMPAILPRSGAQISDSRGTAVSRPLTALCRTSGKVHTVVPSGAQEDEVTHTAPHFTDSGHRVSRGDAATIIRRTVQSFSGYCFRGELWFPDEPSVHHHPEPVLLHRTSTVYVANNQNQIDDTKKSPLLHFSRRFPDFLLFATTVNARQVPVRDNAPGATIFVGGDGEGTGPHFPKVRRINVTRFTPRHRP